MKIPRTAALAVSLTFALMFLAAPLSAQTTAAPTLINQYGPLFLNTGNKIGTAAGNGAACGGALQPPGTAAVPANFVFTPTGAAAGNGSDANASGTPIEGHYYLSSPVDVSVGFTGAQSGTQASTSGFTIVAELKATEVAPVKSAPKTVGPTPNGVPKQTLTIPINETNFVAHAGGDITLTITMTPAPPAMGVPSGLPVQNVAIACSAESTIPGITLVRGMPGEGDLDADGNPDTLDADLDGDAVPNTTERSLRCTTSSGNTTADREPEIQPGAHDADGDGFTDEEECAAGVDPLSNLSKPAVPRTVMQILMPYLLLLIILLIIVALIILFLRFGKIVAVTILSSPELFIPPGQKGKYQVAVDNKSKKGDPRTFQVLVSGMPEGWDAKVNVDNVTLEAGGTEKSRGIVWLEVEAPQHNEPESAVVTVKAVPLNAAGRKDTFKLPGKAETITSINVPPGSQVPVKRGAPVKPAEVGEAADVGVGDADQRPAIDIEGIGETYAAKLEKMGVKTVGDLRRGEAAIMAKKTGANETTVKQWQAMGDLMNLGGVGPQYAEQLVRAGVMTIPQLASEKPKPLVEKIETTNAARETPIQGNAIQEKQAKNFIKAAQQFLKKNPLAVPAAAAPAAAAAAPAPVSPAAAKPNLQVGGLKHEPPSFRQGETVKSSVSVTNNGPSASTIKLSLFVNDGLADVQTVTVKPGKAKDVQFKWTAQDKNKLNIRGELVPG